MNGSEESVSTERTTALSGPLMSNSVSLTLTFYGAGKTISVCEMAASVRVLKELPESKETCKMAEPLSGVSSK